MANYRVIRDRTMTDIVTTELPPDGYEVYATLPEAKREALKFLRDIRNEAQWGIRRIRAYREGQS